MNTVISPVNVEQRRTLDIRSGDTVRVHLKIQEKGKTRLQVFEGLVLARKHGSEAGATFTVRRVSQGVGVEKIFPLYSPMIEKIEITKRSKVRRSKLYHIRDKAAKEIRRQMRNMVMMDTSISESDAPKETEEVAEVTEAPVEEKVEETPVEEIKEDK